MNPQRLTIHQALGFDSRVLTIMAPKKYSHREGPSSLSLMRPNPPSATESPRQSSKDDNTIADVPLG
ncbi:hypothetical protein L484_004634 [Morus notabilis]|uniref:Uncharacterized protein n=1 Tax=Morus notabilis TaxID=981085 RepID=W9QMY6_9ROSA|nr:hypothetical protein L484_004634 [Morus notabilis]